MKYASIDIGTNTILMLIGEIDGNDNLTRLQDFYEFPRVGKSVSLTKRIDSRSMSRALEVLRKYSTIAKESSVDDVFAAATSAVRDADNRDEFTSAVLEETGIRVEVIDGEKEAELVFLGATCGAGAMSGPSLVIDVGGGSTELSCGQGTTPPIVSSMNIGAVRLTEKFLHHLPPDEWELEEARRHVSSVLDSFPFSKISPVRALAVGGTATTLALIAQKRYDFDLNAVENYAMSAEILEQILSRLKKMKPEEILKLTAAAVGRADVLLAGALILREIVGKSGLDGFISTDRGLRHGYMIYRHRLRLSK